MHIVTRSILNYVQLGTIIYDDHTCSEEKENLRWEIVEDRLNVDREELLSIGIVDLDGTMPLETPVPVMTNSSSSLTTLATLSIETAVAPSRPTRPAGSLPLNTGAASPSDEENSCPDNLNDNLYCLVLPQWRDPNRCTMYQCKKGNRDMRDVCTYVLY